MSCKPIKMKSLTCHSTKVNYQNYTSAVFADDITEMSGLWNNLVSAACDVIDAFEGAVASQMKA